MAENAHDLDASQLTDAELVAVERAMHAVVSRDADRIRPMLDASRHRNPDDFWMWANDYGDQRDGGFALDLEVWASTGRTGLTLSLTVHHNADGTTRVELDDLHVH